MRPSVLASELSSVLVSMQSWRWMTGLASMLTATVALMPAWWARLLASERRRQDRRGRRLLLLLLGRAGEGAMEVSKLCPPLASRLPAVPSSKLASVLSAGLAYGPTWPWA